MALTKYSALEAHKGELKWMIKGLASTAATGITQTDLDDADAYAFERVNSWILRVAGGKKGGAIVAEFVAASTTAEVDPAIRNLAHLVASARILRLYEEREGLHTGTMGDPSLRRKDWREIQDEAMRLARDIETSKRTIKADGSVRVWGMGRLQQGPVVGGPMSGGSVFDDRRTYVGPHGDSYPLPHRHPLSDAT